MSVILFHKGALFADSASVISGDFVNYPNLFNTNKVKKLMFSTSGMSVFGATGSIMSEKENVELADVLENTVIATGAINSSDDDLSNYLKELSRKNDSTITLFFMTSVNRSCYFVCTQRNENKPNEFSVCTSELSMNDTVTMGSGGISAFTAINCGLDPINAMQYAIRNDSHSSGPIHYISIDDLNE